MAQYRDLSYLETYKQARDKKAVKIITIVEFAIAILIAVLFCTTFEYSVEQDIIQLTGWTETGRTFATRDAIMNALQLIEAVAVVAFILLNGMRMLCSILPQRITFLVAVVSSIAASFMLKNTSISVFFPSVLYLIAIFSWILSHFELDFKRAII